MKQLKFLALSLASFTPIALLTGCASKKSTERPSTTAESMSQVADTTGSSSDSIRGEVNIYSARHYDVDKQIYDNFFEETGIKVNIIERKAPELLERMNREGADTEADLFITADMANLYQAIEQDLVIPVNSSIVDQNIPEHLR